MLAVRTRDDWTSAAWTVTCGGDTHTYIPVASVASALEWLDGFVSWVAGETWGALTPVASWTWRKTQASLQPAQPDFGVALTEDWSLDAASANASDWLGIDANPVLAGEVLWSSLGGARRGCYAPGRLGHLALRADLRWSGDAGEVSGVGAVGIGTQGSAGRAPLLESVATAAESLTLRDALALALSPRTVTVWDTRRSTWRTLALGEVRSSDPRATLVRITLAVLGDVP